MHLRIAALAMVAALSCGCACTGSRELSGVANDGGAFDAASDEPLVAWRQPSALRRAAWFVPDRLMDLLDVISLGLGVGYGFDVNRHATYFVHVPTLGWYRSFNFFNWYYNRNLCWSVNKEAEAGLLPIYAYESEFRGRGTGWPAAEGGVSARKKYAKSYTASLSDPMFTEGYRDPWALGVHYGPVLLSPRVEADIHPVEIADFVVGLVTFGLVDIREDDYAVKPYRRYVAR